MRTRLLAGVQLGCGEDNSEQLTPEKGDPKDPKYQFLFFALLRDRSSQREEKCSLMSSALELQLRLQMNENETLFPPYAFIAIPGDTLKPKSFAEGTCLPFSCLLAQEQRRQPATGNLTPFRIRPPRRFIVTFSASLYCEFAAQMLLSSPHILRRPRAQSVPRREKRKERNISENT